MLALRVAMVHLAQVQEVAGVRVSSQGFRGRQHEIGGVEILHAAAESAEPDICPSVAAWHGVLPFHVPPFRRRRPRQVSAQRQAVPETLQPCSFRQEIRWLRLTSAWKSLTQ